MTPIEALLNKTENREAYEQLCKVFNKLVPYVGTGLSFYFTSWGKPFKIIFYKIKDSDLIGSNCFYQPLDDIQKQNASKAILELSDDYAEKTYDTLMEYIREAISYMNDHQITSGDHISVSLPEHGGVNESETAWNELWKLYQGDKFLELGELLNIISYTYLEKKFDKWFLEVIHSYEQMNEKILKTEREKLNALSDLENIKPLPPSQWFLPYLGRRRNLAITTNTDNSLQLVYGGYGTIPEQLSSFSAPEVLRAASKQKLTAAKQNMKVFHIHGYQPSDDIDTSDSFIMTWSDYRKAYFDQKGASLEMIEQVFSEESILFIGAGLNKDITVDLMKASASSHSFSQKHIAFDKNPSREKRIRLPNTMATRVLATEDFPSYSTILCHLIRENSRAEWRVVQSIIENTHKIDEVFGKSVSTFLDDEAPFAEFDEEIKESELEERLFPALLPHLMDHDKEIRTYKWSVCRIANNRFDFPIKKSNNDVFFLDTYAAPLGSTIYIIGGANCSSIETEMYIEKIKSWTDSHATGYWETGHVRVRVFRVCPAEILTPQDVVRQLESFSLLPIPDANKSTSSLLSTMSKDRYYNDLLKQIDFSSEPDDIYRTALVLFSMANIFNVVRQQIRELISKYNATWTMGNQGNRLDSPVLEDEQFPDKPYTKTRNTMDGGLL